MVLGGVTGGGTRLLVAFPQPRRLGAAAAYACVEPQPCGIRQFVVQLNHMLLECREGIRVVVGVCYQHDKVARQRRVVIQRIRAGQVPFQRFRDGVVLRLRIGNLRILAIRDAEQHIMVDISLQAERFHHILELILRRDVTRQQLAQVGCIDDRALCVDFALQLRVRILRLIKLRRQLANRLHGAANQLDDDQRAENERDEKNQQIDAQKLPRRLISQTVRQQQQVLPPGRAHAAKNPIFALKRRLIRIEGEGRQRNRIADAEKRRAIGRKHIHGGIRDIFGQQIFPERTAVQLKRHDDGHRRQLRPADIYQDCQLAASPGKLLVINKRRFDARNFHCRKPIFVLAGAERACVTVVQRRWNGLA